MHTPTLFARAAECRAILSRAAALRAAAEARSGAMIALVPTEEDAERLAVPGGEPADELHLTLRYLGKGADFDGHSREHLIENVREYIAGIQAFTAEAFNVAMFNPTGDEPCITIGVGGDEVAQAYARVAAAVEDYGADLPEPHKPFVPHITLVYSGDASMVEELLDRVGPVTFDRVRVAFAGEVADIDLAGTDAADGKTGVAVYGSQNAVEPQFFARAQQSRARLEQLGNPGLPLSKFDPDQLRDDKGRWTEGLSGTAAVQAGDFSQLTKVDGQLGSNPGALYEDSDGQRWYVKAQRSQEHARNEALAAALYKAAKVNVPEVVPGTGAPGLDGPQTASKWVELDTATPADRLDERQSYLKADLQAGFAADAWLANWDVAGQAMDKVALDDYEEVIRVSTGGSMLFRAQGAPKGVAFGDSVTEFDTLRDPAVAPQASRLFGDMSDEDLARSAEELEAVGPTRIRALVAEYGLDESLADRLIARRADILRRAEDLRISMEAAAGGDRGEFGKTGHAALAIPNGSLPDKEYGRDSNDRMISDNAAEVTFRDDPGWSAEKRAEVSRVLRSYRQGTFREVNGFLRGQTEDDTVSYRDGINPPKPEKVADHVRELDDAFAASRLQAPVELWRGLQDPEKVFGGAWSDDDMTGVEWTEEGYVSASANKETANMFGGATMLRIFAPPGVGALRLSGWHTNVRTRGEAEVALQRKLRARVVTDRKEELKHGGTRRVLDVIMVPVDDTGIAVSARSHRIRNSARDISPGAERMVMNYPVQAVRPSNPVHGDASPRAIIDPRLSAEFDPSQLRDENGRWSRRGAVRKALADVAGAVSPDSGGTSSLTFPDREGVPTDRFVEFEKQDDGTWRLWAGSDDLGEDDETPTVTFHDRVGLNNFAAELAKVQLQADLPPLDLSDRRSVLLHAALSGSGGAGFNNEEDDSYIDVSTSSGDGYSLEVGDPDGNVIQFDLNAEELASLHASIAVRSLEEPGSARPVEPIEEEGTADE